MKKTERTTARPAIKVLTAFLLLFFVLSPVFAAQNQPAAPEFRAKPFSNGVLYTFSAAADAQIKYKLFEPLSGSYAEGQTQNGEAIFVLNGITGAAWTETDGEKSLPVVLYPQAELPFADIDSAFISPAEGEWANKQPLVIDIPSDFEAYYSFTATDPLVSGLAYDGPVFIDMAGTVTVNIALVAPNGTAFKKEITYTVADYAAFQPLDNSRPVIYCGPDSPVNIPPRTIYYFGDAQTAAASGTQIRQDRQSDILRYVPLIVEDGGEKYRYVLQTGTQGSGVKGIPPVNGIEFYEWNYFAFDIGSAVSYSIDGGPWIAYTNPVYIERTKPHNIAWSAPAYLHGQVQSLLLPPKPHLTGIPEAHITNGAVTLGVSSGNFVLRHETAKHKSDFLHSVYFDVLSGEEHLFNTNLAVYYNGIRQGTLEAKFTIDKQAAPMPVVTATAPQYSQKPVEVTVQSEDQVFTRVRKKIVNPQPFTKPDFSIFTYLPGTEGFSPLEGKTLRLEGEDKSAVLYLVQAYAQDAAGNTSKLVSFEVCVDTYNIFVSDTAKTSGAGEPLSPLDSFEKAITEANSRPYARIIVSGNYADLPGFTVKTNCEIVSASESRASLSFTEGVGIILNPGASLAVRNLSVSQKAPETNATPLNRAFINLTEASLVIEDSAIRAAGGDSRTAILARDSAVSVKNSQIEVSARSYCAAVESVNSAVDCQNAKIICTAAASEIFTISGGQFTLNKTENTVSADIGRIAGLANTVYSITQNSFTKTGENGKTRQNAVQINIDCRELSFSANTVSGFTPGILRIR